MARLPHISRRKNRHTAGRLSARALVVMLLLPLVFSSATGWATTVFQCRTEGTAHVERCCGEEAAAPNAPQATLKARCCDAQTFSQVIPAADHSVRHGHGPELAAGLVGSLPSEQAGGHSPAGIALRDCARQRGSGPPILLLTRALLI